MSAIESNRPPRRAVSPRRLAGLACGALLAICWIAATCSGGAAQTAATPGAEKPDASAPPSGLVGALGSWMQDGVASMGAGFDTFFGTLGGQANQAAKGAANAAQTVARETAATVGRLPNSTVIAGRERCLVAPNGAPDCRNAAEGMCRAKGYGSGASVDFVTAEKCPRVTNRDAAPAPCTLEHFVTRALCQQ